MALVPWRKKEVDPFQTFFGLDDPFFSDQLFPSLWRNSALTREGWYPAIDISEDKDNVFIKADLPGLKREDIAVSLENNVLTIKGERKNEEEKKDKNYYRVERTYGSFERRLSLGTSVDESRIKAKYNNGVLEISVPKTEHGKSKTIDIE